MMNKSLFESDISKLWLNRIYKPSNEKLLLLGFLIMCGTWILYPKIEKVVTFSAIDDALYYPKIAYNIANEGFCSYDGITTTNGFHPLWLLCLLPIALIIHNPLTGLKVIAILIIIVMVVSFWIYSKICHYLKMTTSGIFLSMFVLMLNIRSFLLFFGFIESHIVLLCYVIYILFSIKYKEARYSEYRIVFFNGVLIGLCFLARLDSFVIAFPFLIILFQKLKMVPNGFARLRILFAAISGMSILVLPYLLYNKQWFGSFITVSAFVKAQEINMSSIDIIHTWIYDYLIPRIEYILGVDKINSWIIIAIMICGIIVVIVSVICICKNKEKKERLLLVKEFIIFSALHFVLIFLVTPFEALHSIWYIVPELLTVSIILGLNVKDFKIQRIPVIPLLILILLVTQLFYYPYFLEKKTMTKAKLEIAAFINTNIENDSNCMMFDSGIVSYFSHRNFVALNGVAGNFEMARIIKNKKYEELVSKYNISYLVKDVPIHKLNRFSDKIVYISAIRSKYSRFQEGEKPFVVYKVSREDIIDLMSYLN